LDITNQENMQKIQIDNLENQLLRVVAMGNLAILAFSTPDVIAAYQFSRYLIMVCILTESIIILKHYDKLFARDSISKIKHGVKWSVSRKYREGYELLTARIYILNILLVCVAFIRYQYINYIYGGMYSLVVLSLTT
jgi:hypothetical protein